MDLGRIDLVGPRGCQQPEREVGGDLRGRVAQGGILRANSHLFPFFGCHVCLHGRLGAGPEVAPCHFRTTTSTGSDGRTLPLASVPRTENAWKPQPRQLSSILCSGCGCVCRGIASQRPSVVGSHTSTIWIIAWYNTPRPHTTLGGRTPDEAYRRIAPANNAPKR